MLAVVICINHVMLLKGVHTVRKEIENCHKQNLGKQI